MSIVLSMMVQAGAWFLRTFGVAGVIIAGMLVYYEGIPVARDLPFIGVIAQGHVQKVADAAVKAATEQMASKAELSAAQATAQFLRAQIERSTKLADDAMAQAEQARADAEAAEAKLEAQINDDRSRTDLGHWSGADDERLRQWRANQN